VTTILSQILAIFLILALGYGACRAGWLPLSAGPYLNKLLINIAQPCLTFYLLEHQTLDAALLRNGGLSILLCLAVLALSFIAGFLFILLKKVPLQDRGIYLVCFTFTNNGFLGLPVAMSLGSDELLFITIMINVPAVILLFALGPLLVAWKNGAAKSRGEILKTVFNLPVLASFLGLAFLLLGWQLPSLLDSAVEMLGNMLVPLSMIVIGMQLTGSRARDVLTDKSHYIFSLLRLALMPAAVFLALHLIGAPPYAVAAFVLFAAMPAATMVVVFSADAGANTRLAAETVFVSHLFAVGTLPVVSALLMYYLRFAA
jgi:predicted permease